MSDQARDFDIGVVRRLAELERRFAYLQSVVVNPGLASGSWTPTFFGTGTAGVYTYGVQMGRYTRIGNRVFIDLYLSITALPTPPTGNLNIAGLPFTSSAVSNYRATFNLFYEQINLLATTKQLTGRIAPSVAVIDFIESQDNGAVTFLPSSALGATGVIVGSGNYEVA